jgi:hypothetical protein
MWRWGWVACEMLWRWTKKTRRKLEEN